MNKLLFVTSLSAVKRMAMYILIAVFFMVVTSKAQNNREAVFVEKAQLNYLKALNTENESLKESAIFNVMALQQYYPGYNYSDVMDALHEISIESANPKVRYKAFVAFIYFKNNDWFGKYNFIDQADADSVFRQIADTLNKHLFEVTQN